MITKAGVLTISDKGVLADDFAFTFEGSVTFDDIKKELKEYICDRLDSVNSYEDLFGMVDSSEDKLSDWELHDESGQLRLDALGGTFWLSDDVTGWLLVKVTVDAAGANASRPTRFATELRAKNWVEYLIQKEGEEKKTPVITYRV